jgi:hypothetical protein
MPLDLILRFRCDEPGCGMELNLVGVADVDAFPFVFQDLVGVKQPPKGWTVTGTDARCPDHASRIHRADAARALASVPRGRGN